MISDFGFGESKTRLPSPEGGRQTKSGSDQNTSLAAPGALANRLQRRTARKANEANLDFPNLKTEITSLW